MIVLVALMAMAADSLTICPIDARTGAPVVGVRVSHGDPSSLSTSLSPDAKSLQARDVPTPTRTISGRCARFPLGVFELRRIGYQRREISVSIAGDSMRVPLFPLGMLDTTHIVASTAKASDPSRMSSSLNNTDVRERGISSTTQLLSALPFAFPRSTRNDAAISLRGARPEQVVVTLDGLPLNDPASGRADIADIPLISLESASIALGSDPVTTGPGASGGVLALTSTSDRALALRAGAFGLTTIEGTSPMVLNDALMRVGASFSHARNDFRFANDIGATGSPTHESRTNNDVTRGSVQFSAIAQRVQFSLLATGTATGMVGPVNVHEYDNGRSQNTRLMMRSAFQLGATQLLVSARGMALEYRDSERAAFNSATHVGAGDLELRGTMRALAWRVGAGADGVRSGTEVRQNRARGFGAVTLQHNASAYSANIGARADAIEHSGILPTFSAAFERRLAHVDVGARAGQSVRTPTLYDLYFSSPQRLSIRALEPERVRLDAELMVRARGSVGSNALLVEASGVQRNTRNAIVWFPGNFSWSPANVGNETLRGIEARARSTNQWLDVSAWSTWYASTLSSGALRIPTPYVPTLALGANATIRYRALRLNTSLRATGARPYTIGPRDPAYELPRVQLLDAAIARESRVRAMRLLWSAGVENIANVSWQSVRGFPAPGRAWNVACTVYSPSHH